MQVHLYFEFEQYFVDKIQRYSLALSQNLQDNEDNNTKVAKQFFIRLGNNHSGYHYSHKTVPQEFYLAFYNSLLAAPYTLGFFSYLDFLTIVNSFFSDVTLLA